MNIPLPVKDDSCRAVYCSHVLEHLSLEDSKKAVVNTRKMLWEAGTFRFVLPDLEYAIRIYSEDASPDAAITFLKVTSLGREKRSKGIKHLAIENFGNSQHLWMWDFKAIEHTLKEVGFVSVRRAQFGDFSDPMFQDVEERNRWENCLGVECMK